MLVPMLQKLNDEQKHYAKIEILNVMKYTRNYYALPVVHYPDMIRRASYQPPTNHFAATRTFTNRFAAIKTSTNHRFAEFRMFYEELLFAIFRLFTISHGRLLLM
ncbi:unnamed protein product [Acanthoscelides obtectus]|uniref:Uncharacterized protein n=1 Tax=Acanthoscelides obtectus TaxID=200917 RepID=A0A9P0PKS8_ACAOB|nr:unnamed protein product [Acanthoscelides obtectus]CAK1656748.1 hypothetical protein AOBTE_LOCUS19895 [Acanthoscelides obtectus]